MNYSGYKFLYSKLQKDGTTKVWGIYQIFDVVATKKRFNISGWKDAVVKSVIFSGNIQKNKFKLLASTRNDRFHEYARNYRKSNYVREIYVSFGPQKGTLRLVEDKYPNLHEQVSKYAIWLMLK